MADVVQIVCWSVLLMLLMPLNILCLLVLRHTKRVNNVTKLFLVSLTCADLNVCFVFVIPAIGIAAFDGVWPYGKTSCLIQALFIQPNFSIVTMSLFTVNLERFIAISYPLRHPQIVTFKRARVVCAFIWLSVIPVGVIAGFLYDWKATYSPTRQSCSFADEFWYLLVIQDVMLLLTVVMYARIVCIVHQHHRNQTAMTNATASKINKKDRKSATTIFLLSFSTLFCLFPLELVLILHNIFKVEIPFAVALGTNLCFASSGIWDGLLYYMRNKAIKQATVEYLSLFRSSSQSVKSHVMS